MEIIQRSVKYYDKMMIQDTILVHLIEVKHIYVNLKLMCHDNYSCA